MNNVKTKMFDGCDFYLVETMIIDGYKWELYEDCEDGDDVESVAYCESSTCGYSKWAYTWDDLFTTVTNDGDYNWNINLH